MKETGAQVAPFLGAGGLTPCPQQASWSEFAMKGHLLQHPLSGLECLAWPSAHQRDRVTAFKYLKVCHGENLQGSCGLAGQHEQP